MAIKITGLFDTGESQGGGGEYPILEDFHLLGGFRVVQTVEDRDNITTLRRKWGMLVYIIDDKKYFILEDQGNGDLSDNNNWVEAQFSGGNSCGYTQTFNNSHLVGGRLTVQHNLKAKNNICNITIRDNNNRVVEPDDIIFYDDNTAVVDLSMVTPIDGEWAVIVNAICDNKEVVQQMYQRNFNSYAFNTMSFN